MQKKWIYSCVLILLFINIKPATSSSKTTLENCVDPFVLCPFDILSVTLNSIEVHPGTYDKGGHKNTALELRYYLELGVQRDVNSVIMSWHDNDDNLTFPANFSEQSTEYPIHKKNVSMLKQSIKLFNSRENIRYENFYSKINFIVKERKVIGASTLCTVSLAKPDQNNTDAYEQFLNLVHEANESEQRKAQAHIHLNCFAEDKSSKLTFKFLFEFERQQLD